MAQAERVIRGVNQPMIERRRISLDLPVDLAARLERQVVFCGIGRRELIEGAIGSLVRQFEQIDAEEGVGCPECGASTDVDDLPDGRFRVCVRCLWRYREPERAGDGGG